MRFVLTGQIEANREEVFDLLLAADSQPRERWSLVPNESARTTLRGEPISSPPPSLSRFWLPLRGEITTELVQEVRPSELAFRWSGDGIHGELLYLLRDGAIGTALEQHTSLVVQSGWSALAPFVRRAFYHSAARRLDRIKKCFRPAVASDLEVPRQVHRR